MKSTPKDEFAFTVVSLPTDDDDSNCREAWIGVVFVLVFVAVGAILVVLYFNCCCEIGKGTARIALTSTGLVAGLALVICLAVYLGECESHLKSGETAVAIIGIVVAAGMTIFIIACMGYSKSKNGDLFGAVSLCSQSHTVTTPSSELPLKNGKGSEGDSPSVKLEPLLEPGNTSPTKTAI
ncbi:hypothetical protein ElyMa_003017500 [Elysia marginata]|uniref:Uncharacterized protein n=1 Tax=Elysia marginata TaxID=1093978 RepID=A0AAV4IEX0_9GAST|nr:hypothetical protein ElyMa_003017500 [Elysia marginata]